MRISVIIPTYNRAHLLRRALGSIVAQTVDVDEIIVVDDGSTDDTRQMLEESYPFVRYVHQPNAGAAVARNSGIAQASCQWIAFLDTDDEWLPHKIESQKRILQADRSLKWCSCAPEMVFEDGRTVAPGMKTIEQAVGDTGSMQFFKHAMDLQIGTGSYLIHRSVFREAGAFDPNLKRGEDRDLWWRIAMRYPRIGFCRDILWRIHADTPDSLSKIGSDGHRQLSMICRNMRLALQQGTEVAERFYPFARTYAIDYLYRQAGRHAEVNLEVICDATSLFKPTHWERATMAVLSHSPAPVRAKLLNRITL